MCSGAVLLDKHRETLLHLRHDEFARCLNRATIPQRVHDPRRRGDMTLPNEEIRVATRPQPMLVMQVGKRRPLHQQRVDVGRGQI